MDFAFEKREKEEGYGNLGGSNVTNQSQILREMLSDAEINSDAESRHASNRKIALQKREDTNQKQAKIAYLKQLQNEIKNDKNDKNLESFTYSPIHRSSETKDQKVANEFQFTEVKEEEDLAKKFFEDIPDIDSVKKNRKSDSKYEDC